ncbi:ROK family protein [Microlunatus sp. Gsoil 973]|uniref:ROK family protein n=1 Tax=Microlunatus sp. Gsoil 973 TaxID=2672569 RepID=UPI0018A805D1|nr:ROK family protein [Microlunatus sp. Gsoil 973]
MSPDLHRQANTATVLRTLAEHGPASLANLRQLTRLSRPTLEAILADLATAELVAQAEPGQPQGDVRAGRPARNYLINPDAGFVAGVDVGRHKVLVTIAELTGAVRTKERTEVPPRISGPELLEQVQQTMITAAARIPVRLDRLHGVTVGVPGAVDGSGRITRSVVVPQWDGHDIGRVLGDWAGVPIMVGNDANLAVLAEQRLGAARLCRDVVYILAGRRTRAAFMINGTVLTGRHGEAGEIGSVPELFFDTPEILLGDQQADSEQVTGVFAAARAGDPDSRARVRRFSCELARSIRFLITVLDPEMVVIGGGPGRGRRPVHPCRCR